jgi:hypothetical protein
MARRSNLIRWGGLAAMLGSLIGLLLAPIITSAYYLLENGAGRTPPWEPALGALLGPLFAFASPDAVYATYGKVYILVFSGFLLGLVACRARRRGHASRLEEWGYRLSLAGVAFNLLGNIGDYWYRGGLGESGVDTLGFLLGTVLGLLLLVAGSALLGIGLLRAGTAPRLGALLLVLALPGIALLTLLGFGNAPSGPALWFCFAWLVLGWSLWSRRVPAGHQPVRAT